MESNYEKQKGAATNAGMQIQNLDVNIKSTMENLHKIPNMIVERVKEELGERDFEGRFKLLGDDLKETSHEINANANKIALSYREIHINTQHMISETLHHILGKRQREQLIVFEESKMQELNEAFASPDVKAQFGSPKIPRLPKLTFKKQLSRMSLMTESGQGSKRGLEEIEKREERESSKQDGSKHSKHDGSKHSKQDGNKQSIQSKQSKQTGRPPRKSSMSKGVKTPISQPPEYSQEGIPSKSHERKEDSTHSRHDKHSIQTPASHYTSRHSPGGIQSPMESSLLSPPTELYTNSNLLEHKDKGKSSIPVVHKHKRDFEAAGEGRRHEESLREIVGDEEVEEIGDRENLENVEVKLAEEKIKVNVGEGEGEGELNLIDERQEATTPVEHIEIPTSNIQVVGGESQSLTQELSAQSTLKIDVQEEDGQTVLSEERDSGAEDSPDRSEGPYGATSNTYDDILTLIDTKWINMNQQITNTIHQTLDDELLTQESKIDERFRDIDNHLTTLLQQRKRDRTDMVCRYIYIYIYIYILASRIQHST